MDDAVPAAGGRNTTRGRRAGPGEAQDTVTLWLGSAPQVRWICSGVPSAAAAAFMVAARAEIGAAAASRPVPPALARICLRVIEEFGESS